MRTYILRYTYTENVNGSIFYRVFTEYYLTKFNARLRAWLYKRQYNANCKIYVAK